MPAVGKVTLDIKEYEAALRKMESKTASAASASSKAFQRTGGEMNKGAETAQKLASAFGGAVSPVGKLGGAIAALCSGPVAALTAALSFLVTLGVEMWDRMTLSAEEYAKKLEVAVGDADSAVRRLQRSIGDDNGLVQQLQAMAEHGDLTQKELDHAQKMVDALNSRYKGLGLTIGDVINNTYRLGDAQGKIAKQQLERLEKRQQGKKTAMESSIAKQLFNALGDESSYLTASSADPKRIRAVYGAAGDKFIKEQSRMGNKVSTLLKGGIIGAPAIFNERFLGFSQQKSAEIMANGTTDQKIAHVTRLRDTATRTQDIERYQKILDQLQQVADLELEIARTKDQQLNADASGPGSGGMNDRNGGDDEGTDIGAVKIEQYRALMMKFQQMTGNGREAAIEDALYRARQDAERNGRMLSLGEEGQVRKVAGLKYDMENMQKTRYDDIKTNSLTARGGFSGGAAITKTENINKDILKQTEKLVAAFEEVGQKLTESEGD